MAVEVVDGVATSEDGVVDGAEAGVALGNGVGCGGIVMGGVTVFGFKSGALEVAVVLPKFSSCTWSSSSSTSITLVSRSGDLDLS